MNERAVRGSVGGRVAALGMIAVVLAALGYVRFGLGGDSFPVPAGAAAGQLSLRPCTFTSENRTYPADCGTLVVPENRSVAGSRLIALPVTRIRAQTGRSAEPLFYLEGGPGLSNTRFPEASRFVRDRDVVLVGYRGVDGSVRLDCPEVESALAHSTDLLEEPSFRAYADALRACTQRLRTEGVDLAGYGLPQQVDDLEAARIALGYPRIDLLSQSAGTRTAMIYAWRYPAVIHRSVMIGVNPPGHFLFDARTTDEQVERYADLCAGDAVCRSRTDDLAATMRRAGDVPDHWLFLPIARGDVRIAAAFALAESTPTAGLMSAPSTFDAWLTATRGDPSGLWLQSLAGKLALTHAFVWGQYASAGVLDGPAARTYFAPGAQDPGSIGFAESAVGWGGGRMAEAWPPSPDADVYRRVRPSPVETLLIGGALDAATPPQAATTELLPTLQNGHQVVLPGIGHIASFFAEQPEAGSHLINVFLTDGTVDTSRYGPQHVAFTPATSAPAVAKTALGLALGLAVFTVLGLALVARRAHIRGRLGRPAAAAMRTGGAVVSGVGGWLLAVIVALTAVPGFAVDNEILAMIGVGVPVGLSVFLGWTSRDRSRSWTAAGFAVAAAAAVVGVWLGLHATVGVFALATALSGATACANLGLIALDTLSDRRTGTGFADRPAAAERQGGRTQPGHHHTPDRPPR